MKDTFDISTFIRILGEDLIAVFNRSSENGIHPDEVGKSKEIKISKQLEAVLPNGVGIGRGFVFDSYGNISNQCDIVVYEKDIVPVFVYDDNQEYSYYPCEGVIAVGEIKSTLNTNEFVTSIEKLKRIKRLQRRYSDSLHFRKMLATVTMMGADSERFDPIEKCFDNIFTFLFCKENQLAVDTIISKCIDTFSSEMNLGIDKIYSLNKPTISKARVNNGQAVLLSERKANAYLSLRTFCDSFGMLIADLTTFISHARSQPFNLSDYYSVGDIHIDSYRVVNIIE